MEQQIPTLTPTCISEAFGNEIPDDNRLTEDDIKTYITSKKKTVIDPGNLPFNIEDDHSSLDKKFPMCISKVIEFYEQGGRYKEFRNILKKQKRKEDKAKNSPMPPPKVPHELFGSVIRGDKFIISFE